MNTAKFRGLCRATSPASASTRRWKGSACAARKAAATAPRIASKWSGARTTSVRA